jgi:hypothetical protein
MKQGMKLAIISKKAWENIASGNPSCKSFTTLGMPFEAFLRFCSAGGDQKQLLIDEAQRQANRIILTSDS